MAADPVPDQPVFVHNGEGTIIEAYANRIYLIVAFDFLELKAGMCGIALKEPVGVFRVPLDSRGQRGEQPPELPRGTGLH